MSDPETKPKAPLKTARKKSTIIKEGQDKPKAEKSAHYVDNEKFFQVLIDWQQRSAAALEAGNLHPRIPEYIGVCVLKICQRLATLHYFSRYTYQDEMILNAIENCIKKLKNFNAEKTSNPFSYFTQIAYYSFIGTIADEKKRACTKYKLTLEKLTSGELADNPEYSNEISEHVLDNVELQVDYLQEYVSTYEEKNKVKAVKSKKAKEDSDAAKELFE